MNDLVRMLGAVEKTGAVVDRAFQEWLKEMGFLIADCDYEIQYNQPLVYVGEKKIYLTQDSEYADTFLMYRSQEAVLKDILDAIDEEAKKVEEVDAFLEKLSTINS